MNGFSFEATAGTSQSTVQPKLPGYAIHDVVFDGCEIKDVKGVKDPDITYKQLIIKFKNENGIFEHTVWEPKADDFKRKETEVTKDGKVNKIPQPSNVESMMLLLKHVIDAVNPVIAKKIDSKEKSISAPNWDELRNLIIKITDPAKGVLVKIKLVENNKGEPIFPGYFAGLTKEGVAYIKNNFIGPKIALTTYEIERMKNKGTAKPNTASMGDFSPIPSNASLDMDFEI